MLPSNQLYLEWIGEWMEEAQAIKSKAYYTYKKAYNSLKKCPVEFRHPSETRQLEGIGDGLVTKLEQRMKTYCEQNGLSMPSLPRKGRGRKRYTPADLVITSPQPSPKKPKPNRQKQYVPQFRSGPYAILLSLISPTNDEHGVELCSLTKEEVIEKGQPLCDASFDMAEAGKSYTAWSSMKTLMEKGYVYKHGKPHRYRLTSDGLATAKQLYYIGNAVKTPRPSKTTSRIIHNLSDDESSELDYSLTKSQTVLNESTKRADSGFSTLSTSEVAESRSFEYWYLDPEGKRVKKRDEAHVKIDEISFTISYKIQFSREKSKHSFMKNIKVETLTNGFFVGFLSETFADPECTGSLSIDEDYSSLSSSPIFHSSPPPFYEIKALDTQPKFFGHMTASASMKAIPPRLEHEIPDFDPITFEPGSFDIVLILDNREIRKQTDREYIKNKLETKGVKVSVRSLDLGDVIWAAKKHSCGGADEELVLDYVVERKRADDLVESIKDGRFHEQKSRLANCGATQIIYILEEHNFDEAKKFGLSAINTAISSTQVVDGFFLKRTATIDDTIEYLVAITRLLRKLHEKSRLYGIPDEILTRRNLVPLKRHLTALYSNQPYLLNYMSYSRLNRKSSNLTLRDLFVKMLMTVRGISAEKAAEIVKWYPTPRNLIDGFRALESESLQKDMLKDATSTATTARKRIGSALSEKVWQVWGAKDY